MEHLFVSVHDDGQWRTGPALSSHVLDHEWLWRDGHETALLVAERDAGREVKLDVRSSTLRLLLLQDGLLREERVIQEQVFVSFLTVAPLPDGKFHVFYVDAPSMDSVAMRRRIIERPGLDGSSD